MVIKEKKSNQCRYRCHLRPKNLLLYFNLFFQASLNHRTRFRKKNFIVWLAKNFQVS